VQKDRQPAVFGKRREPHTIIIARGDNIRHFTIRPWVAALAGSVLAAGAIGYLLATTYLVLRDDLIGATVARQARMQQAYEDRIAALRAQVDRITSRQLLDQQLMETKVSELLERQSLLSRRHGRIGPILDRLEHTVSTPPDAPTPEARPDQRAEAEPTIQPDKTAAIRATADSSASVPGMAFWSARDGISQAFSSVDQTDRLFLTINQSLRTIEDEQIGSIVSLADDADKTADAIADALEAAGLPVESPANEGTGVGGPLIAVDDKTMFETRVRELDEALQRLETVKKAALVAPIHNPAPGYSISSSFGVRRDPLLGTPAMHAGIDFRVPSTTPVRATGAGTVVKAGRNGGYGRMVEIDHGDGLSTRFAHLSKVSVSVGQRVSRGEVIGNSGSSGRSTGPHLHYEVRRNGVAIDPLRFIKAGKKIANLL